MFVKERNQWNHLKKMMYGDDLVGIDPETILKAYKWIWGQEDCNYPNGQGRWLSMNNIIKTFKIK